MKLKHHLLIARSALIALIGILFSGPVGFLFVQMTNPQPTWESPALFARNYQAVQDVPYYFGFLLIAGMLMLFVGHYLVSKNEAEVTQFWTLLALSLTTIFAALIFFNYICQTTFVRQLALNYKPENDAIISAFTMANPQSLSWGIEMWGYGILGSATWFLSGYYAVKSRIIFWTLIMNGVVSILTVVFTIIDVNWLLSPLGLAGYFFWNLLMIVLMILIYRYSKNKSV